MSSLSNNPLSRPETVSRCGRIRWPHGNYGLVTCGYIMMWKKTLNASSSFVLLASNYEIGFELAER